MKGTSLAKSVRLDVKAEASSLAPFRKRMQPLLEASGFDSKSTHDILLSVDEVLTNIIRHAYGNKSGGLKEEKIQVSFSDFDNRVEILIEDHGPFFDPLQIPAPELPPTKPGGLGLHLVHSLTDEIHYEPLRPRGNRLRLVKYKKGERGNRKP